VFVVLGRRRIVVTDAWGDFLYELVWRGLCPPFADHQRRRCRVEHAVETAPCPVRCGSVAHSPLAARSLPRFRAEASASCGDADLATFATEELSLPDCSARAGLVCRRVSGASTPSAEKSGRADPAGSSACSPIGPADRLPAFPVEHHRRNPHSTSSNSPLGYTRRRVKVDRPTASRSKAA